MSNQPLNVVGFIKLNDGRVVSVDDLTLDEIERCRKSMRERLSRTMSDYFSQHIDEYIKLHPLK